MFNGEKLALARRRVGLTKVALAQKAGITTRALNAFENGEYTPSEATEQLLAQALGFPASFFYGESLEELDENGVSFRSLKRMTASQKHAALAAGSFAYEINKWIDHRFSLPLPNVPNLHGESPSNAARIVRDEWGIGKLSISNMIHLVEANGVRVYSLFENAKEVDAFSVWNGNTPFIFSNRLKSSAHRRFDIAHELGHLVLHRHGAPSGPVAEKEADQFASAFLMPSDTIKAIGFNIESLDAVLRLKERWMVSPGALTRRLKDTGMISEWTYRSICIEISQRGYRTSEPNDYPHETSKVWQKITESLRASGQTLQSVSDEIGIPYDELQKLVWGLVTVGIPSDSKAIQSTRRGSLKLVN